MEGEEMHTGFWWWGGDPEGKRPLGGPRPRWEDNIRMDLKEMIWEGVDWIDLAQDRGKWRAVVNTVMNGCHKIWGIS
jgi:hypothetical protein